MNSPAPRRVIAGVAEAQPATLRFAIDEARRSGLDLEVVHCAGYVNYSSRVLDQIYFENWHEAAEHVLHEARQTVWGSFEPLRSHFRMADRPPVDELLDLSKDAAEIVVGSDNPSWFSRMLSPAVAQTVARTAHCPVVVVPEFSTATIRPRGVVVGIEGTRPEENLLRYAFEHADHMGRELLVVHALPVDAAFDEVEAHQIAVAEALAGWGEKFPDVAVTRQFVPGLPTRVCARATQRAELVVVGQPHHRAIPFATDSPMSNALLKRAHGPIAVVPDAVSW